MQFEERERERMNEMSVAAKRFIKYKYFQTKHRLLFIYIWCVCVYCRSAYCVHVFAFLFSTFRSAMLLPANEFYCIFTQNSQFYNLKLYTYTRMTSYWYKNVLNRMLGDIFCFNAVIEWAIQCVYARTHTFYRLTFIHLCDL